MADKDFVGRVVGAAAQGAVGAVVAACLSSVTEPIVNRVLVKRIPLQQALAEISVDDISKFAMTALPTNFIKFPFFEAVNVVMTNVKVTGTLRGSITGAIFCTTTLPITNYRFRKSMNMPIDGKVLYQAYLPTVLRDIIYGIVRNEVMSRRMKADPEFAKTNAGRFLNMFITVIASCVISAPGNELRGYCLQPPDKRQSPMQFFQPSKFVRSTSVGAMIMGISLGIGTLATPKVEALWGTVKQFLSKNPLSYTLIVLFIIHQILETRRASQVQKAVADKK